MVSSKAELMVVKLALMMVGRMAELKAELMVVKLVALMVELMVGMMVV